MFLKFSKEFIISIFNYTNFLISGVSFFVVILFIDIIINNFYFVGNLENPDQIIEGRKFLVKMICFPADFSKLLTAT